MLTALRNEGFVYSFWIAYESVNRSLTLSQMINVPVHLNTNYQALLSCKYGWPQRPSAPEVDAARRFLSRIGVSVPTNPSPRDILRFRQSDEVHDFRTALLNAVQAFRGDAAAAELSLSQDFLWRLQRYNQEASKVGAIEIALLSGIASTVGALVAGAPGAIVGGVGASATALAAQAAYSWIYRQSHKDWAAVFSEWVP